MKLKSIFIFLFLLLSQAYTQDFKEMLRQADALVTFNESDFSAEYTIVREVPGKGQSTTVCIIFRRDKDNKYVILITEPAINKGQGYLKLGDTVWFYDPESRKFNSTSSRERFQNSIARNSDFTRSTLAQDYDVIKGERVMLGVYNCWLLSLKANNNEVNYPYSKIWISDDGLVRKIENYSLSQQLMRTIAIAGYQKIGNRYVPQKIIIVDNLSAVEIDGKTLYEKVQITISKPSLKPLPDSVFSKAFLENITR